MFNISNLFSKQAKDSVLKRTPEPDNNHKVSAKLSKPKRGRPRQTHCKNGHPLEGANILLVKTTGERRCRACYNERMRRYYHKKQGREVAPVKRSYQAQENMPTGVFDYWMPPEYLPHLRNNELTREQREEMVPFYHYGKPHDGPARHSDRDPRAGEIVMYQRQHARESMYESHKHELFLQKHPV